MRFEVLASRSQNALDTGDEHSIRGAAMFYSVQRAQPSHLLEDDLSRQMLRSHCRCAMAP